jgi:hypothetical protein
MFEVSLDILDKPKKTIEGKVTLCFLISEQLFVAVQRRKLSKVGKLLSQGVDLNWKCKEQGTYYTNWSPLMYSYCKRYTEISEKLLEAGAKEPTQEGLCY